MAKPNKDRGGVTIGPYNYLPSTRICDIPIHRKTLEQPGYKSKTVIKKEGQLLKDDRYIEL
jgi:hypothetical protein